MGQELIIDVRELDEFKRERVPGSLHLPLSQLEIVAPGLLAPLQHCSVTVMCRSGGRAGIAHEKLVALGLLQSSQSRIFQGGLLEWKRQGRATEGGRATTLPLMRQVQLAAGGITLLGSLLAWLVNPVWVAVPLFVGAGLSIAGSTGFCGLALLLQKMPWNRPRTGTPVATCAVQN